MLLSPIWLTMMVTHIGALFSCCTGKTAEEFLFLLVVLPSLVAFFLGTWVIIHFGSVSTPVRGALLLLYCPLVIGILFAIGSGSIITLGHGS